MGYYVNPEDGSSKEDWLNANADQEATNALAQNFRWEDVNSDSQLPVCLVDNGPFTAAGIAYDEDEFKVFMHEDGRAKTWYIVDKNLLQQFM